MINKLMTEINQKIEKLNKLLEDEEYFRNLEIVIDRQNKYNQELAKKLQQKGDIIKEVREYIYRNAYDEKRKEVIEDLWVNEIKDILEILDKGVDI